MKQNAQEIPVSQTSKLVRIELKLDVDYSSCRVIK